MPALNRIPLAGSLLLILVAVSSASYAGETLTLMRAEKLAIAQSPLLSHHRTNVTAASERAVYDSRLPDPQPGAHREAQVTTAGSVRDANELREAQMRARDAELDLIRLRVDLAKSHAELLCLTGEPQI